MSFTPAQRHSPDRESLPLKKRDQHDAIFKRPRSLWSSADGEAKRSGQIRPRRTLHQPWTQTRVGNAPKTQVLSAFREHVRCTEQDVRCQYPAWDLWQRYVLRPDHVTDKKHHLDYLQRPSTFDNIFCGYNNGRVDGWQHLKSNRVRAEKRSVGAPYMRREGRSDWLCGGRGSDSPALSTYKGLALKHDTFHTPGKVNNYVFAPSDISHSTLTPLRDSSSSCSSGTASSSGNPAPWLQPHFMAGSLVELQDGRLRKVEHLKTEDFLLGALACPDLRLGYCTVQSITSSPTCSSVSRLLILLHDLQSQELVDVYAEYPFFVCGQGWSSCSPERTARLCGLQCHQLSVGDVCLALTPVSPECAAGNTSGRKTGGTSEPVKEPPQCRMPPGGERKADQT